MRSGVQLQEIRVGQSTWELAGSCAKQLQGINEHDKNVVQKKKGAAFGWEIFGQIFE